MTRDIQINPVQEDDSDVPRGAEYRAELVPRFYDWEPKGYGATKAAAEQKLLDAWHEWNLC